MYFYLGILSVGAREDGEREGRRARQGAGGDQHAAAEPQTTAAGKHAPFTYPYLDTPTVGKHVPKT